MTAKARKSLSWRSSLSNVIYIGGGGAKNTFLNELTEKASGKKIIALPIEATAIGNLKIQMEAVSC